MAKKIILLLLVVVTITAYILLKNSGKPSGQPYYGSVSIGYEAPTFTLGMADSKVYELKDLFGKYTTVLMFVDNKSSSQKFLNLLSRKNRQIMSAGKDVLWFNLITDGDNIVIREVTKTLGLKFRTAARYMPHAYHFTVLPTIIVIDKTGTVKMVYSGYSPTFADDIVASINGG